MEQVVMADLEEVALTVVLVVVLLVQINLLFQVVLVILPL